jgi:hypothetical protein
MISFLASSEEGSKATQRAGFAKIRPQSDILPLGVWMMIKDIPNI